MVKRYVRSYEESVETKSVKITTTISPEDMAFLAGNGISYASALRAGVFRAREIAAIVKKSLEENQPTVIATSLVGAIIKKILDANPTPGTFIDPPREK